MLFDVYTTPEWRLRNRLDYFAFSLELFQRNYSELTEIVNGIEQIANPVQLLAVGENWKLQELIKEVSFRFHNFLAAAKSLLDHARTNYRRNYEPNGLFPEYPAEAKSRFESNGLVQLVHGLREMAQHYRLPNIGWRATFADASIGLTVTLQKQDLLAYEGWKAPAKIYLTSELTEIISVRQLATDYYGQVNAFYEWLFASLQRIHASEFERLHSMQDEELKRNAPQFIEALERAIVVAEQSTHGSNIRDLVSSLLTPIEQRNLHGLERNPSAWLEAALPTLMERAPIPPDLVLRLKVVAHNTREPPANSSQQPTGVR